MASHTFGINIHGQPVVTTPEQCWSKDLNDCERKLLLHMLKAHPKATNLKTALKVIGMTGDYQDLKGRGLVEFESMIAYCEFHTLTNEGLAVAKCGELKNPENTWKVLGEKARDLLVEMFKCYPSPVALNQNGQSWLYGYDFVQAEKGKDGKIRHALTPFGYQVAEHGYKLGKMPKPKPKPTTAVIDGTDYTQLALEIGTALNAGDITWEDAEELTKNAQIAPPEKVHKSLNELTGKSLTKTPKTSITIDGVMEFNEQAQAFCAALDAVANDPFPGAPANPLQPNPKKATFSGPDYQALLSDSQKTALRLLLKGPSTGLKSETFIVDIGDTPNMWQMCNEWKLVIPGDGKGNPSSLGGSVWMITATGKQVAQSLLPASPYVIGAIEEKILIALSLQYPLGLAKDELIKLGPLTLQKIPSLLSDGLVVYGAISGKYKLSEKGKKLVDSWDLPKPGSVTVAGTDIKGNAVTATLQAPKPPPTAYKPSTKPVAVAPSPVSPAKQPKFGAPINPVKPFCFAAKDNNQLMCEAWHSEADMDYCVFQLIATAPLFEFLTRVWGFTTMVTGIPELHLLRVTQVHVVDGYFYNHRRLRFHMESDKPHAEAIVKKLEKLVKQYDPEEDV